MKQTGDGFFASFENPKAAIEAAVAIQRALAAEIVAPDVRIGAHSGARSGRRSDRLRRPGRPRRVADRSGRGGGEILVSAETLDGVGATFRVSEPRTETLKGIAQPVEVVSVDWR